MSKALAVSFLALLYLDSVRTLSCLLCKNVVEDNSCFHNERRCKSGGFDFCYSRMITKGKTIVSVDRGCSPVCRIVMKSHEDIEENMLCCVRDYCNTHNFWTNI